MPGYGVNGRTHRIELKSFDGSDEWVDIKAQRSSAAATRIQEAAVSLSGISADGTPMLGSRVDLTEMRVRLFEEAIVAWSLKADEADDSPMPLNRDTYASVLAGDVGSWLDGQITAYYQRKRIPAAALGESSGSS